MENQIALERLVQQVKAYANELTERVARGADSPSRATQKLRQYGHGVADAVIMIFDTPRTGDPILRVVDDEMTKIDPLWREQKKLLTTDDIAEIIRVSGQTIDRMVKARIFPAPVSVGQRLVRFKKSDVQEYLESLNESGTPIDIDERSPLVTIEDAVEITNLSAPTIRRHIRSGTFPPPLKMGRSIRFVRKSLEKHARGGA